MAIDQFEFGVTTISDSLNQADRLPEMQENPLYQENPLLQDVDSFLQMNESTSAVPTKTVRQSDNPVSHHDSSPTNAEPEPKQSAPVLAVGKDKTNVDSQIPQQSEDIDLNRQEENREDTSAAQLMDVPIVEGHHNTTQPKLGEDKSEEGPLEGLINVGETQIVPAQESD